MNAAPTVHAPFRLRSVDPVEDADILHTWVTEERLRFWGMLSASRRHIRG